MQTINVYIPLKLRLRGELSEDNWTELEKVLFAQYTRAIERSLAELAKSRFSERGNVEPFAVEGSGKSGFLLASYEPKKPVRRQSAQPPTTKQRPDDDIDDPTVYDIIRDFRAYKQRYTPLIEAPDLFDIVFGNTERRDFSTSEEKALRISSTIETGHPFGFDGLTGNFDGMGLSLGLLQWNIGTGSLQPLLREYATQYPQQVNAVFGPEATRFRQMLYQSAEEQLAFAVSINNARNSIVEPWAAHFHALAADPLFQCIEIKHARQSMDVAVEIAEQLGLQTERGLALVFDNVTQDGPGWLKVKNRAALIQQRRAEMEKQLGRTLIEREFLEVIANVIADTVKPKYKTKVLQRRMTIVQGHGTVHGEYYDLERDFGLTDDLWRVLPPKE